ncbi:hypothetical protein QBC47DRAFT_362104 [Echria macrotheca]|uniref:Uncharacterized protein n=1 Tax=Echria macrotheca TaxID=438768 RepID=A0AAJ0BBQ9_9PEZI|nr:hypothetical protein QBC47DRAFT_362104 [Echria macrotheca]
MLAFVKPTAAWALSISVYYSITTPRRTCDGQTISRTSDRPALKNARAVAGRWNAKRWLWSTPAAAAPVQPPRSRAVLASKRLPSGHCPFTSQHQSNGVDRDSRVARVRTYLEGRENGHPLRGPGSHHSGVKPRFGPVIDVLPATQVPTASLAARQGSTAFWDKELRTDFFSATWTDHHHLHGASDHSEGIDQDRSRSRAKFARSPLTTGNARQGYSARPAAPSRPDNSRRGLGTRGCGARNQRLVSLGTEVVATTVEEQVQLEQPAPQQKVAIQHGHVTWVPLLDDPHAQATRQLLASKSAIIFDPASSSLRSRPPFDGCELASVTVKPTATTADKTSKAAGVGVAVWLIRARLGWSEQRAGGRALSNSGSRRDKAQTQTFNGLHAGALVSACLGAGVNGCRSLRRASP